MKPKIIKTTQFPTNPPIITLSNAEKTLRDIARRNGWQIRKRRSQTLKQQFGDGYSIVDPKTNGIISRAVTHDGCDLDLQDVAAWFKDDEKNTPWQDTVISSVSEGQVAE